MNLILYVCCMLSGMFLGVMFFTIIENASKSFRQFVRKFCMRVDLIYRRIIMWFMILLMGYIGYVYMPLGLTFNGLIAGAIAGIFIYFKAGVTLGKQGYGGNPYAKGGKGGKGKEKVNLYKNNKAKAVSKGKNSGNKKKGKQAEPAADGRKKGSQIKRLK